MKKTFTRIISLVLALLMVGALLAACGGSKEETKANDSTADSSAADTQKEDTGKKAKIGVLVSDVSGEEAQGFRKYYEEYIAKNYNVEFSYTEVLEDAAAEKSAIEKFASQGYDAILSLAASDRAMQIETCAENKLYYAVVSGMLDDEQYETFKTNEYFVGQIGPSMQTEYEAGVAMGEYFKNNGAKTVAMYGAFIPNPMHVYRAAGVLKGIGATYGGTDEMGAVVGQIFGDQGIDVSKVGAGDVKLVSYFQGYGDTTPDELNAAIQLKPDAFISVGMATTFFAQQLNTEGIKFADIDSFTSMNNESMKNGSLAYLAGKYSSSIGPIFAVVYNAVNGNVIRDKDGNALSISQGYRVATSAEEFDELVSKDNGDTPIYSKEVLDGIISSTATYDDVKTLVEAN
ncbi:MAG: substrate-binding domain-containing protein [Ruminococcus sp.]|nr:substrate-binding domain-containing protein [Ruminococcus sp.]